ncbi:DUF2793 domain-containing protein [Lacimonas salitolerans]|uniref:DUF2793 domain-containing protein n=1 Tax=Lacimonas salitolerans TaxID=1323750 RepID=A0ABW4ECK1_9RHOB
MSDTSAILSLPYIQPAQAQKHVTHNEALRHLDLLVQLTVTDRGRSDPPAAPEYGARHIVGTGAIGDWAGQDGALAVHTALDGWQFVTPLPGWRAWVLDEARLVVWDGSAWTPATAQDQVALLGINTQADPTNRLAVAAPATLLNHDGAGHQVKINKSAETETASLLFQTGWSGRAEMGTAGSDGFAIKVSADGTGWATALSVDPATGLPTLPQGARIDESVSGSAVTQSQTDTTAGRLTKTGDFGIGGNAPSVGNASVTDNSLAPGVYAYATAGGSSGGPSEVSRGLLFHGRPMPMAGNRNGWWSSCPTRSPSWPRARSCRAAGRPGHGRPGCGPMELPISSARWGRRAACRPAQ